MGKWFEYERYATSLTTGTVCVIANYTLTGPASVRVVNAAIRTQPLDEDHDCPVGRAVTVDGTATIPDPAVPAKLSVTIRSGPGPYWVLETDYDNYTVVYSCNQMASYMPIITSESLWILTRQRSVAPANLADIKGRLTKMGVDVSRLELTDHRGCPEWPAKE